MLFPPHREELKQSHRLHQCFPIVSGKAEGWTWITLLSILSYPRCTHSKWVIVGWGSLTLPTKDSHVSASAKVWTLLRAERIITSITTFYNLLFNLNTNKIPNHSIHFPMVTPHEEEADTASESQQNKPLHSCSLETFFLCLQGLLFLPWGNDWDCIFPIPLQLIQPHLSSLLPSLSSLVISDSSSIFIFQLNQTYLLALLWLI